MTDRLKEISAAEKYWTENLGMAEPKYCANGAFEYFQTGWDAREQEIERLRTSLAGMLESYDVVLEIFKGKVAEGSLRGGFLHEPRRAREILKGKGEG